MGWSIDNAFCKGCGCELTIRYRGFFCDSSCRRVYQRRSISNAKKLKEQGSGGVEQSSFGSWAKKASKRGIPWALEFHDFMNLWQKPCWYCGSDIQTVGIDRKDSSIGYRVGNCVPCCGTCNLAKMTLSVSEFVGLCVRVSRHWPGDYADGQLSPESSMDAAVRRDTKAAIPKKKRKKKKPVSVFVEKLPSGGIQMTLF